MSGLLFPRLLVIGPGLIGGSLALAARQAGAVQRVTALSRSSQTIAQAQAVGAIDAGGQDVEALLAELQTGDLILLAMPTLSLPAWLERIRPALARGVLATDVASVKGTVVKAARDVLDEQLPNFVPGHPIAGSEKSGAGAALAGLFHRRRVILTPLPETDADAVSKVTALWQAAGAEVLHMPPDQHDEVLAATSHLPHLLAYALVDALVSRDNPEAVFRLAAGGFRDFTRIAASDPQMWHDIALSNREALLRQLADFGQHLEGLRQAIADGDGETLLAVFQRAQAARRHFAPLFEDPAASAGTEIS